MRPLELKMTAFGSYAEETTIRFSDLKHGLYLVTGDTGAGKTTIFDAIMFALFGTSSGKDRENSTEMLHSDFVSRSVDTVVKLRFLQDGRECVVKRTIHFKKKHGGAGIYHDPSIDAELTEPGRPVLKVAKNVTRRCEELLGLNVDQFRKIVMLAQGEFKEFLKADSDKKGEILGKLFDSAPYRWYQNLLVKTRDALKTQRDDALNALKTQMNTVFIAPDGMDDEEKLLFSPYHSDLIDNLNRLIEREDTALVEMKAVSDKAKVKIDDLNIQKGAAEGINDQFARLREAVNHSRELEEVQPAYDRRKQVMQLAERALHRALPAVESHERAEADLTAAQSKLDALIETIENQKLILEAAQRAVEGDKPVQEKVDALNGDVGKIEEQLPLYDELKEAVQKRDQALKDSNDAQKAEEEAKKEKQRVESEIKAVNERIEALKDIDVRLEKAQARFDKDDERLEALIGKNGIRQSVQTILKREYDCEVERKMLRAQTLAAAQAQDEYNRLYQHFIMGQAGLLADDLRAKVEREGEARCPVCGSSVYRSQLPGLATLHPQTPDKKQVDHAKEEADKCERDRSKQDKRVEGLEKALESDRRNLVEKAARWLADGPTWERLCDKHYLNVAIAEAQQERNDAEADRDQKREDQETRGAEQAKVLILKDELEGLNQSITDNAEKKNKRNNDASVFQETINGIRRQLIYENRDEAVSEKGKKESERDAFLNQINSHNDTLKEAESALNTSIGMQSALKQALQEHTEKRSEAMAKMHSALEASGFGNVESVREALLPIGNQDGEVWLGREQKAQFDYENDKRETKRQIDDLTEQTAGRQPVDLESLEAEINAAQSEWSEKHEAANDMEQLLDNHREVVIKAGTAKQMLVNTQGAWDRIEKLANMAAGTSGGDGKRSFERYVLSATFQDVLEMANQRLDQMSGGRYELVIKEGAKRQNSAAGLDIDVLDHSTNQQRSSASLSGGESFFTSLSLALGLSDVVQSHAGGRQLDALFIDEGFGTLSDSYLDKALEVLNQLTEGNRLVGIISHVDKLDESIPQKIRVYVTENGSRIESIMQ